MRESPDQRFDATITRTLRFETLSSPRQQTSARERLLSRAAAQTMLPPLQIVEERSTLRDHASVVGQQMRRVFDVLFIDSRAYERARRLPRFYQHYNVHGRRAFTIIHMSA